MAHLTLIPHSEIIFDFARSGGAGGQNVNKVESKVIIHWSVGRSAVFTSEEKTRIRQRLANRLSHEDFIVIAVEEERSQAQNREIAVARLNELVEAALIIPKKRRPTKPTRGAREARLETKKRTSAVKRNRKKNTDLLS